MCKFTIIVTVLAAIALPLIFLSPAYAFSDVSGSHWAREAISFLNARGIIHGVGGNRYDPERSVTRAEMVKLLLLATGKQPGGTPAFSDVPATAWHAPYLAAAVKAGIIPGGTGAFRPDDPALREEIAQMIVEAKGRGNAARARTKLYLDSYLLPFSDRHQISAAGRHYVTDVVFNGEMGGYPDGTFRPQQPITRAEAATVIKRIVEGTTYFPELGAPSEAGFTADGQTWRAVREYHMVATAYDDTYLSNGHWGPVDALGKPLRLGVVAVDPRVIPLGTRVVVTGHNHPHLPPVLIGVASDMGSAIKGSRIDIFIPGTTKQVSAFGIQSVKLYVVERE